MKNVPTGWSRRRSGILVPGQRNPARRVASVGGLLLAAVMLAPPVANGVSALAHAVVDVADAVAVVLSGDEEARRRGSLVDLLRPGAPAE